MRFKTKYEGSSFSELLAAENVQLFPSFDVGATLPGQLQIPHGTTVLAFKYADGVMVGGDRLATEGHRVASRDIQKVYPTDNHSVIAIAGAAGPCIEMARIMRVELEHYEKIEGEELELDGKANKLAQMIRANLPAAMQGLVVVPLFAGYDLRRASGRLWKFDVTGGRYEESEYEATGSGGLYARESLKKSHHNGVSQQEAVAMAVQALVDAADEDRATGGIDVVRRIFPNLNFCTADGIVKVTDEEIESVYRTIIEDRSNGRGGRS